MTSSASIDLTTLRTLIRDAGEGWQGLDWDSELAPVADRIRGRKRVDIDSLTTWYAHDGSLSSQTHRQDIRRLARRIEDEIDEDTSDDVREEIAAEAERLAGEEDAYVTGRADVARDLGRRAIEAAEADDLDQACDLLEQACSLEREFGDAPDWAPALAEAKRLRDALADAE